MEETQIEILKKNYGGARPGAGRPKGKQNAATLIKSAVQEKFNQRVMAHADDLFNAQYKLAVGSQIVFRIDRTTDRNGKPKEEHVQVTNPDEIKALLDEHGGDDGEVNDHYYYFQAVPANNQALDSMLNRTFGRAKESIEHSGTIQTLSPHQIVMDFIAEARNRGMSTEQIIQGLDGIVQIDGEVRDKAKIALGGKVGE